MATMSKPEQTAREESIIAFGDAIFSFPSSEVPRIVETPLGPIQSNCVVPFFQFVITVFVFIFLFR